MYLYEEWWTIQVLLKYIEYMNNKSNKPQQTI